MHCSPPLISSPFSAPEFVDEVVFRLAMVNGSIPGLYIDDFKSIPPPSFSIRSQRLPHVLLRQTGLPRQVVQA